MKKMATPDIDLTGMEDVVEEAKEVIRMNVVEYRDAAISQWVLERLEPETYGKVESRQVPVVINNVKVTAEKREEMERSGIL